MTGRFLIYGANGYTGELITRYAAERGMKPILAGRNAIAIEELAKKHHLEYRVFSLDENARLDAALQEVDMVLHCAGPFSITSRPMVEACLRNKKHYTDITGEISVFESMAALDDRAKASEVMIMPGVGFDVVPSDCLALHLKNRLPSLSATKCQETCLNSESPSAGQRSLLRLMPATTAVFMSSTICSCQKDCFSFLFTSGNFISTSLIRSSDFSAVFSFSKFNCRLLQKNNSFASILTIIVIN